MIAYSSVVTVSEWLDMKVKIDFEKSTVVGDTKAQ